jgi:hypothetical protein
MADTTSEKSDPPGISGTARRVLRWTIGILAGLLLVRLLAPSEPNYGTPGLADVGQPVAQQNQSTDLLASVKLMDGRIELVNRSSIAWSNCRLSINEGMLSGGYELDQRTILAGAVLKIPVREFAKSSGERFNLLTLKANTFSIFCDTPAGRASFIGQFE